MADNKTIPSNRLGDFELNKQQQEKMNRYQYCYNQLAGGKYTETEVVSQLQKFFSIKKTQAYEDLAAAKEIFSTVLNINKRFELMVQLNINKECFRRCVEKGDEKSAAAYEKNRITLLSLIEDTEDNAGEMFEGHTIEATFDPSLLGAPDIDMNEVLTAINEKRAVKIKIDMFNELNAENIEHEEIPSE